MFDGLTMVNVDGQMPDEMMVDHGRPWSDGHPVAGVIWPFSQQS